MAEAYIVAAVRTAGGRRGGALRDWHPVSLGAAVLDEVVARSGIDPSAIEDVIMGCVGQLAGQTRNLGRNAVMASSLPLSVPGVTVDRQCGSSQQAVQFAAQAVLSGTQDVVIAAGVESMTRVPMNTAYTLPAEKGMDTPYTPAIFDRTGVAGITQFAGAEMIVAKHGQTREQLDAFALTSHQRAAAATRSGAFRAEILALQGLAKDGAAILFDSDEGIRYDATLESIGSVKTILEGGLLSAATASQISDGASALMVVSERALKEHGLTPLARIHALKVTAGDPVIMLEEPLFATPKALARAGLSINDIDLYEVNEAFASIPLAWLKALNADPGKLNVNGGAIALGHPLGSSGVKLMTTLIHALRARGKRYGLQTMCEGGGTANVTILEAL
jgi:acetyl-CoA C-acetyltransferase